MRRRRPRRWETREENDPIAGLINLFDLWMVFSIALLIIFVGASRRRSAEVRAGSARRSPEAVALDQAQTIPRFRLSREELRGEGERLGTAYRLASGEIVCVPETDEGRIPAGGHAGPLSSPAPTR